MSCKLCKLNSECLQNGTSNNSTLYPSNAETVSAASFLGRENDGLDPEEHEDEGEVQVEEVVDHGGEGGPVGPGGEDDGEDGDGEAEDDDRPEDGVAEDAEGAGGAPASPN